MKTIFISDLHLADSDDPRTIKFLSFMDREQSELERLIVGGDLFDLWIGDKGIFFSKYQTILNKLSELRQKGIEIVYLEGNHDFSLSKYFSDTLKIHVVPEEVQLNIGGAKVFIAHGDQVNREDHGYLFLRWFLRTPFLRLLVKILPSSWLWALSHRSSYVSRHYRAPHPNTIQLFRDFAKNKLESDSCDVVILGHTHHPDEQVYEIAGKKKYYFNTGDWLKHFTYLECSQGQFSLKKF